MGISIVNAFEDGTTNGGDVTFTFAETEENDVVFVFGGHGSTEGTISDPTGYTNIVTDTTYAPTIGAYKVMGSTPDTSVVCDGGGNAADGVAYICYVLRGVDTSSVLDVAATTTTAAVSPPDCPSITPTTNGSWVFACASSDNADTSFVWPLVLGRVSAARNDTADITSAACAHYWVTAEGAYNPAAYSLWSANHFAASIAFRPSSSTAFRGSLLRGNTG